MALIDVVNKIKSDIKAVADAIREKNNLTGELTLEQMADEVAWISGSGSEEDKAYILVDEDGNELPAVRTDEEIALTATANDIRLGTFAVTDQGVIEGSKEIPSYNTTEGSRYVPVGSELKFPLKNYEYTKLQILVCKYNSSMADSVSTEKVSINSNVYNVGSTEAIASVTINSDNQEINLGITNEMDTPMVIRYFTYKEIY